MKFLITLVSTAFAATFDNHDEVGDNHYHHDHDGDAHAHEYGTVHDWDPEWYDYDEENHEYHGHDHHAHNHSDYHYDHHGYDHDEYAYDGDYIGIVPNGDYYGAVHDYNVWDETWGQADYEWRLEQEASLMVSLEAMREALVDLDHDVDNLDHCISDNDDGIRRNDEDIDDNDHEIHHNDEEIDDQEYRAKKLARRCRIT